VRRKDTTPERYFLNFFKLSGSQLLPDSDFTKEYFQKISEAFQARPKFWVRLRDVKFFDIKIIF
jgi:hypothetical protein